MAFLQTMENSQLPETQASAETFASLCTDMAFLDLDVIEERT